MEVEWANLDKQKFFINGFFIFSGVTTVLFPLSVVKTRQMADHTLSGGFSGMKQTVTSIWKAEGVPGFYRGFATVIFGTIPARMIYLTALEVVKDGTTQLGKQMELSPTTTAGLANFAGGAAASLSTQLVTVPIDVISQRQIVHGTQGQQQQQHAAAAAQSSAAPRPQAAAPAAAARPHASTPAPAAAAAAVQAQQGGVRSYHTRRAVGGATMWPAQQHLHHLQRCGAVREGPAPWLRHVVGAGCHGGPRLSTAAAGGAAAASQRISGLAMMRIILKEEGVAGLYRGFGMSVATFVPSSAVWWASYGVYTQLVSSAYLQLRQSHAAPAPQQQQQQHRTAAAASAPSAQRPSWWRPGASKQQQAEAQAAAAAAAAAEAEAARAAAALSGREVVGLQVASSVLAGATASLLTNPLDLIKTRIQVAVKVEGQALSVRGVVNEILREDGAVGLLRGALPRMVNSAMWGTCMVTAYEFLKRISVKTD